MAKRTLGAKLQDRPTDCKPLSNIIADDKSSTVCVGLHGQEKPDCPDDIYRHCFISLTTDSVFDYDEFDMLSVISTFTEALLINRLEDE